MRLVDVGATGLVPWLDELEWRGGMSTRALGRRLRERDPGLMLYDRGLASGGLWDAGAGTDVSFSLSLQSLEGGPSPYASSHVIESREVSILGDSLEDGPSPYASSHVIKSREVSILDELKWRGGMSTRALGLRSRERDPGLVLYDRGLTFGGLWDAGAGAGVSSSLPSPSLRSASTAGVGSSSIACISSRRIRSSDSYMNRPSMLSGFTVISSLSFLISVYVTVPSYPMLFRVIGMMMTRRPVCHICSWLLMLFGCGSDPRRCRGVGFLRFGGGGSTVRGGRCLRFDSDRPIRSVSSRISRSSLLMMFAFLVGGLMEHLLDSFFNSTTVFASKSSGSPNASSISASPLCFVYASRFRFHVPLSSYPFRHTRIN